MSPSISTKKIAVFMTLDILRAFGDPNTERPMATMNDGTPVYTNQWLERALSEGYEVWVVSTRAHLYSHDTWWRNLLPPDRILLAREGHIAGPKCPNILAPWRMLYERLELPWDETWDDCRDARNHLPRLGIKLGRDDFQSPRT